MSDICIANSLIIASICLMYPTLIFYYYLIRSDIRILKNAKNISELDKWALRYVKKNNFNKDAVLTGIIKELEYCNVMKKIGKWGLFFEIIFVIFYFVSRNPNIIRISNNIFISGRDNIMILDGLLILCVLATLYVFLLSTLIEKRDSVAHEQFTRLFKEEKSSSN